MSDEEKRALRARLDANLAALDAARGTGVQGSTAAARRRVREWQGTRLRRTYADLLADPRYALAAEFFLSDLYGPDMPQRRDASLGRIAPMLVRMLPVGALETIVDAVELDALSESLDAAMAHRLPPAEPITAEAYAEAYRQCGRREERARQIALVPEIGHAIERLTRIPFIETTLRLMRGPARAAGFGEMQDFLERGFSAFRSMGPAEEFLATIVRREGRVMERLLAGEANPFGTAGG